MLISYINENKDNWEDLLPFVLMSYRSAVHESTGCSPNLLQFGREIQIPIDIIMGTNPNPQLQTSCYVKYVEWLKSSLKHAFEFARSRMQSSVKHQKHYHDRTAKEKLFKQGDLVLYYKAPEANKKLGFGWHGPGVVIKAAGKVAYEVKIKKENAPRIFHSNHLKLFMGDVCEEWLLSFSDTTDRQT